MLECKNSAKGTYPNANISRNRLFYPLNSRKQPIEVFAVVKPLLDTRLLSR